MTRHQLPAALCVPLRAVLFEDEQGKGIFEYDKPSSFFGQYGDEHVTEVGRYLDAALETILHDAAGQLHRTQPIRDTTIFEEVLKRRSPTLAHLTNVRLSEVNQTSNAHCEPFSP